MLGNTLLVCGLLTVFWAPWAGIPLLIVSYFIIKKENRSIDENQKKQTKIESYDNDQYDYYIANKWKAPLDYKTIRAAERVNNRGISQSYKETLIEMGDYNKETIPIDHKSWLKTQINRFEATYKKEGRKVFSNLENPESPWRHDYDEIGTLLSTHEKYEKICNYLSLPVDKELVDDWTGKKQEQETSLKEAKEAKKKRKKEKKKKEALQVKYDKENDLVSEYLHEKFADIQSILGEETEIVYNYEPKKTYYENGQLKEERYYTEEKRSGVWKVFFEDGGIKEARSYNTGEPKWAYFYSNDKLIYTNVTFLFGYESFTLKYYIDGKLRIFKRFNKNAPKGDLTYGDEEKDDYETADTITIDYFTSKEKGRIEEYYEDFVLKEKTYLFKNGYPERIERYNGQEKHGIWEFFDKDNILIKKEKWFRSEKVELDSEIVFEAEAEEKLKDLKNMYEKKLITKAVYEDRQKEILKKMSK